MKVNARRVLFLLLLVLPLVVGSRSGAALTSTTTSISCTLSVFPVGTQNACTVTVSGSAPTGTVTITSSGSGSIVPTSCTLSSSGGCTVGITGNEAGSPTIQASYSGDMNNSASVGTTFVTISQVTTTTVVTCTATSVGSASACTASVTTGYSPTGTVNWTTNGVGQFAPATSCSLSSGSCSISYTPSQAGSVQISGTYGGDTNNYASTGVFTLVVSQFQSITLVACSPQTVVLGLLTTCTATVNGYFPTGSVSWASTGTGTFSSTSCALSGSSPGVCQVTFTPQTSSTITATYNGDSNNVGSFGTFQVNAIVNRYFQFTVDNSGPSVALTLSGCSVSPTSVIANGTAQMVHSEPSCGPIIATLPTYNGSTRYVGPEGASSFAITSCSSSSCQVFAATVYYQLQNVYEATPRNPSAWTTSGSIAVLGTWAGAPGTNVCTIKVAGAGGQSVCQGWSDYKRPVSMSDFAISSTQRWSTNQPAYTDATANNLHNANYYFQLLQGFRYSLIGSSTAPSAPALSYTAYGTNSSFTLQNSLTLVWLDSSSTWTAPQVLTGSTVSERWAANSNNGSATAGQNVTLSYYHQFFETLGYSVVGGPSGSSPPAATLSVFGLQTKFQLTNQTTRSSTWADAGKNYNFTNPLVGSTATARWFASNGNGTVSSSTVLMPTYYYQYAFFLSFAVLGGGQPGQAQFNTTAFGSQTTTSLTSTATIYWLDAGSSWRVSAVMSNSTASERWTTSQQTSGTAAETTTVVFQYYHQFLGKFVYQVLGGGSPVAPALKYTTTGVVTQSGLSTSSTSFWMDSGTNWYAPALLNASASTERWIATSATSGTVTSAFEIGLSYKHQFFVSVAANTPLGGTVSNSTGWYDSGSRVNLTATVKENWSFEYWQGAGVGAYNGTAVGPSFSVSGPTTETAVYYPSFVIEASQGGSVSYSCGTISGVVKPGLSSTVYLPLGGNLTLTESPSSLLQVFIAWSGNATGSGVRKSLTVLGPGNVSAAFGLNTMGISESVIVAVAAVAAVTVFFIERRKRINLRRRVPQKKESWL